MTLTTGGKFSFHTYDLGMKVTPTLIIHIEKVFTL